MAQVDYYLKSASWKGESKNKNHTDEIEVLSWSWGGEQGVEKGGSGFSFGRVQMAPLVITKFVDKASAKFLTALAKGEHVADATLTCLKATGKGTTEEYLTIKLSEVFVSKYELGSGATESTSIAGEKSSTSEVLGSREKVTLQYNKVEFNYKAQDGSGALSTAGTFAYSPKTGEVT